MPEAGIARHRIAIDPGIGFGKTDLHNLELLDRVGVFHGLGCAVMIGVSRKSFIGRIANVETPKARLPGTLAATVNCAFAGGANSSCTRCGRCSTSLCHLECAE